MGASLHNYVIRLRSDSPTVAQPTAPIGTVGVVPSVLRMAVRFTIIRPGLARHTLFRPLSGRLSSFTKIGSQLFMHERTFNFLVTYLSVSPLIHFLEIRRASVYGTVVWELFCFNKKIQLMQGLRATAVRV